MIRIVPLLVAVVALLTFAPAAFGYQEPNTLSTTSCGYCHPSVWINPPGVWSMQRHAAAGGDCSECHGDAGDGYDLSAFWGPHGGYLSTTSKCDNCHTVHVASGPLLLPGPTIVSTCETCHDGTGGWGVYGTIKAVTGSDPGSAHSVETTSVIPGGDATTGGDSARTFRGPGGTLICTDCHTPHGSNAVTAFVGDRRRLRVDVPSISSSRLLKRQPTGSATAVADYGSDWCLACHQGRASVAPLHNHPVDSLGTTSTPFTYKRVAVLASDSPTSATVVRGMGGLPTAGAAHYSGVADPPGNRGFLMPFPRTTGANGQSGHFPICQQCHEDSRQVGALSADGTQGDAATAQVAAGDGVSWNSGTSTWTASVTDNPRFQNFPHETQNPTMLVEINDDLCLNCHPVAQLP